MARPVGLGVGWVSMTSIERTAYPRFKRLITARELHVFFTPSEEERAWAEEVTDSNEHQLALLVALKSYQRMGCFPKGCDVPDQVVEFVRRAVELPESTVPVYGSERTAKSHRSMVRERCGVRYDGPAARKLTEKMMRLEAASKNNLADLINIALEKLVEAGLEIPRFSTLDAMASTVRGQVNEEILAGIRGRMTEEERRRLLGLPDVLGLDRKTLFNALKQNPGRATWSNFKRLKGHLEWVDGLGDTAKWLEGVASTKTTDFAGEAEAQDAATLKDYIEDKRVALIACLAAKARMRARDDLATMFCKRMAAKAKKAREELAEIHRQQQEIVEALIGNYRTLLQHVDKEGPAQTARARAAALTKQALDALEGLDEESSPAEVAERLGGKVSLALLLLAEGLTVQSNGLASLLSAVDTLGGFEAQYVQIEKVSAHHGDNWEVLLHGHLKADRPVMFDLTDAVELKATSEDASVLHALAHAKAHRTPARDYIPDRDGDGRLVDVSFATQNWQKAIRDRRRPGYFVRRHFEAMVFFYLAEELRCGDVAVIGSEEYADWSEQLLAWEQVEAKLPEYLVEVGLREPGDATAFDGRALVSQLRARLTEAAAKADGEYPDNDELFIDSETGVPKLKPRRAEKPRKSAQVLEQAIKERMPERSLLGIVARTAYWIEWWHRFGPASGNDPKLKDPFGRYVITTLVKGTNMTFAEAARHITGVSAHELSVAARRHVTTTKLNEALADTVNAHAKLDMSRAWGNGTTAAADGTHMDTYLDNLLAETSVRYGAVGGIAYHHISDLYIALFTHFVWGVGGGLYHRGPAEERFQGAAGHDPRRHPGPELPGVRARTPARDRSDAQDPELEGLPVLPPVEDRRLRAHRCPVRRGGPQRDRLGSDRHPLQGPDAGDRLGPRGHHLLHAAAQAAALGLPQERHLYRLPRGRAGDPYHPAAAVLVGRAAARQGDGRDEQGRGVQRLLRLGAIRPARHGRGQRPGRAGEGCEVHLAAGQPGDLPQHPGHRRRGAAVAGRGMGHRPAGPGPDLPVPDRAHQPVRRLLNPRTRRPARGVRRPPRRRLQRAGGRAGPGRMTHPRIPLATRTDWPRRDTPPTSDHPRRRREW